MARTSGSLYWVSCSTCFIRGEIRSRRSVRPTLRRRREQPTGSPALRVSDQASSWANEASAKSERRPAGKALGHRDDLRGERSGPHPVGKASLHRGVGTLQLHSVGDCRKRGGRLVGERQPGGVCSIDPGPRQRLADNRPQCCFGTQQAPLAHRRSILRASGGTPPPLDLFEALLKRTRSRHRPTQALLDAARTRLPRPPGHRPRQPAPIASLRAG